MHSSTTAVVILKSACLPSNRPFDNNPYESAGAPSPPHPDGKDDNDNENDENPSHDEPNNPDSSTTSTTSENTSTAPPLIKYRSKLLDY